MDIGLWDDFFQLPPIKAKAIYNDEALKNQYDILGQALYKLFDRTVKLDLAMRQQGDDPGQQKFRNALEGLYNNDITQDHWRLLATRVQGNLSAAEIATFDKALRIYGKKKDVNTYNHEKIRDLGVPVKQTKAQHTGTGAAVAELERGGNLHKTLPLCLGARVMLMENS